MKLVEQFRTPYASVAGNLVCRSNSTDESCDGGSDKVDKMVEREKWEGKRNGREDGVNFVSPRREVTII